MSRGRTGTSKPLYVALALGLAAFAVAYFPLLNFEAHLPEPQEIEGWLFQVGSGTPPALILVISAWLLYRRRERAVAALGEGGSAVLAVPLLVASTVCVAWAHYTTAPDLLVPSLMLGSLGAAASLGGLAMMRVVLLPVAFLFFAIKWPAPLVNESLWMSQLATAHYAGAALDAVGFPAFVSGEQILQADRKFAIIEACAGLKTVETLTMLAVLMVDLFGRTGWRALVIIIAAPAVAFTTNAVRSIVLMLSVQSEVSELVDMQGVLMHNVQGIAMLLLGLTFLYLLDGLLERVGGAPATAERAPLGAASWAASVDRRTIFGVVGWMAVTGAIAVAVPPFDARPADTPFPMAAIPEELEGWQGVFRPVDRMYLGTVAFRGYANRHYQRQDGAVATVFVGADDPTERFTSGYSPKTRRPGSGWILEDRWLHVVAPSGPEVEALVLRKGSRRRLVYHWREAWRGLGRESARTALALDRSPFARQRAALVVRLTVPLVEGTEADRGRAGAQLDDLVVALAPHLERI